MTFPFCVCVSDLCITLMHAATHSFKIPGAVANLLSSVCFHSSADLGILCRYRTHTNAVVTVPTCTRVPRTHTHVRRPLTPKHAHNTCAGIIRTNANLLASHYQQLIYSGMLLASNTNARAPLMLNTDAVTVRVLSQPAHPGLSEAS